MTRSIFTLAIALAAALAVPSPAAFADDKQPTPEQIDAAKKAFADGKALHDAGKLKEAAAKFVEAYKLSKNPVLLYNVGLTLDEAGDKEHAVVFYRKFLNEAPKDDTRRAEVDARVKALEKEAEDASLNGGGSDTKPPDVKPPDVKPPEVKPTPDHTGVQIKPAGTYKAEDFQHVVVTEAPPSKPLDLSSFVPEDSGFVVTMYFRKAGESAYTSKNMKWRYKELVGRIPAAKMTGTAIQYYIEVKDQAGTVITRSGKATSPNLIDLDAAVPPRFYPDLQDDSGGTTVGVKPKGPDDDNPLGPKGNPKPPVDNPDNPPTTGPEITGNGFFDVGSSKFKYTKWGATGAAGALFATSIVFYLQAGKQASALRDDVGFNSATGAPCTAPCHKFDSYDSDLEAAGKRDQTLSRVTLGIGVVATGVAAYYWYREKKGGGHAKPTDTTAPGPTHDELGSRDRAHKHRSDDGGGMSWIVVPAVGDGFTGAAAAARF